MYVEKGIRKVYCLQTFLIHRWSQLCWPETEIFLWSGLRVPLSDSNLKCSPMQYGSFIKTNQNFYLSKACDDLVCTLWGGSRWKYVISPASGPTRARRCWIFFLSSSSLYKSEQVIRSLCTVTHIFSLTSPLDLCKSRKAENDLNFCC